MEERFVVRGAVTPESLGKRDSKVGSEWDNVVWFMVKEKRAG